ncbi:MAG: hypothetical protein ACOYPR_10475 [Saprospiraceae bacterium]
MKNKIHSLPFLFIFVLGLFWGCGSNSNNAGKEAAAQGTDTMNNVVIDPGGSNEPIKIVHAKVVRDTATNSGIKKRKSKSPFTFQTCCNTNIQPCCCDTVWTFYKRMLEKNNIKESTDVKGKDPYFHLCDSTFESFRRQVYLLDSLKFGQ